MIMSEKRIMYAAVLIVFGMAAVAGVTYAWTNPTQPPPSGGPGSISVPIGSVTMYTGAAAPSGWLLCNGVAVSRATYANLFAVIGVAYGAGDGSTTFNVPDMRDRVFVGASGTKARGSTGGNATVNLSHAHNVNAHSHSVSITTTNAGNHQHSYSGRTDYGDYNVNRTRDNRLYNTAGDTHRHTFSGTTNAAGDHAHTVSGNTGTATATTDSQLSATQSVQDPYQAGNYIIKY